MRPAIVERNDYMAEFFNSAIVTVAPGQNVPFTESSGCAKSCIIHREGTGIITLRGLTEQCKARFKVSFGANIAVPTGGTVEAITTALAVDGEALNSSIATVTPAAVENYFNIYGSTIVDVPRGCCVTVAVTNTNTQAINFSNANMIVERIA